MIVSDGFKSNIARGRFFDVKTKTFHGHTKIYLGDPKTGKKELVADKDNMVTLALPTIFENNLGGVIDYETMTPLKDMFAGVMCFHNALDTSSVMPQNGAENTLVCFAGKSGHEQASSKRGTPNGQGTGKITDTSYQFQWDFAANVGNVASINSLALCHGEGGDIGLEPLEALEDEYLIHTLCNKSIENYRGTRGGIAQDDYLHGVLAYDIDTDTGYRVTSTGAIQKIQFSYKSVGLNYKISEALIMEEHDLSLTAHYFFYGAGHIYGAKVDADKHGITLYDTNLSTWTTTSKSIVGTGFNLLLPDWGSYPIKKNGCIALSGDYIYLPTDDLENYVRICIATGSESATVCAMHTPTSYKVFNATALNGQMSLSEGLVVGGNYIINGTDLYPSTSAPYKSISGTGATSSHFCRMWIPIVGKEPLFLEWSWTFTNSPNYENVWYLALAYPTVYLATIQNLSDPVTKTSARDMTIIYTLSETEET